MGLVQKKVHTRRLRIKEFVNLLRAIQNSNNDVIVAISGERGVGKSTLMMQLARAYKRCGRDKIYDINKYHIYSQEELIKKMEAFRPKEMLCGDEIVTALFKRDFGKKRQIDLIKMFNTYRDKYFLFFMLLPNFIDLDIAIRNSMIIKFWIFCTKRGRAAVFTHIDNPISKDSWNTKQIMIYYDSQRVQNAKNFVCYLHWKDLSKNVYDQYQKVKATKRAEAHGVEQKERDMPKRPVGRPKLIRDTGGIENGG